MKDLRAPSRLPSYTQFWGPLLPGPQLTSYLFIYVYLFIYGLSASLSFSPQLPLQYSSIYLFIWRGCVYLCVCGVCLGRRGNVFKYFVHLLFFFPFVSLGGFERLDVGRDVCLFPEGERLRSSKLGTHWT